MDAKNPYENAVTLVMRSEALDVNEILAWQRKTAVIS